MSANERLINGFKILLYGTNAEEVHVRSSVINVHKNYQFCFWMKLKLQ